MAEFLNDETFEAYVAGSPVPVLVDFYKDGCIPCRRVAPLLSKAGAAYEGKLRIVRVNFPQSPNLAQKYQIEAAPTLLFFKAGQETARHRGVIDREGLAQFIEAQL